MEQYINLTAYQDSRQLQTRSEVDRAEDEIRQRKELETVLTFIQAYLLLEAQKKRNTNPRQAYPTLSTRAERKRVDLFDKFSQVLIGSIVTLVLAVGGAGVAREFINNPQQPELTAPPTATQTARNKRLAARNAALYKELVQSRRNPDGRLYHSFQITEGETDLDRASLVNVRKEPQLDSAIVERLPVGTVLKVDNIVVEGDNPYTLEIEENAGKWVGFDCNEAGITKVGETPIPKGTFCTVSGIYAKPKK